MSAMDVQIKQEMPDLDLESQEGRGTPRKDSHTPSSLNSTPTPPGIMSQNQIAMANTAFQKNIPYLNGLMATTTRPVMAAGVQSPVLVVPQPYPHYVTYYRPQFPGGAASPTNPYQALDLSKPANMKDGSPAESPKDVGSGGENASNIPYEARERTRTSRSQDGEGEDGEDGVKEAGEHGAEDDGHKKSDIQMTAG